MVAVAGCEDLEAVANAYLEQWAVGRMFELKPLSPGKSGAAVWKIDIRGETTLSGALPSGQYVLKAARYPEWDDQETEVDAHARAEMFNSEFARLHIPKLVMAGGKYEKGGIYCLLVEIAGASMDCHGNGAGIQNQYFRAVCKQVVADLLNNWSRPQPDDHGLAPAEILEHWLGYRLDPKAAPALHDLVKVVFGDKLLAPLGNEALVNPLAIIDVLRRECPDRRSVLRGMLHNDLHGENLLFNYRAPEAPYWIIDFGLSREGLLGFDQAYIEVAQIIYNLGEEFSPQVLVRLLGELERQQTVVTAIPQARYLLECFGDMRGTILEWIARSHPRRQDDLRRQFVLARIAAGLNWANKPLSRHQRVLCLAYAAFAARQYVELCHPKLWSQFDTSLRETSALVDDGSGPLWGEFLAAVKSFDGQANCYVLVAEGLRGDSRLGVLGHLPWSLVIDLDPYSDRDGLLREMAPVLKTRRGLHVFSGEDAPGDLLNGTKWMMACGWVLRSEHPTDRFRWGYERLSIMRAVAREVATANAHRHIVVVVLPGLSYDEDDPSFRLQKSLETLDEATRGSATILMAGDRKLTVMGREVTPLGLMPAQITRQLAEVYSVGAKSEEVTIPGPDGSSKIIPIETLRIAQENLDILHSGILDVVETDDGSRFWAGRPPTWRELSADIDVPRSIAPTLKAHISEMLGEYRNQSVVLVQSPGAGGTTLARRIAWDLHRTHPVVLLRHYSAALPDRIQSIYNIAERPILIVAEASKLTESAREDLHRELSARNARYVILYLRKAFRRDHHLDGPQLQRTTSADGKRSFELFDPMTSDEPQLFLRAYRDLTDDDFRLKELSRIVYEESCSSYRSPFFFGLITFERHFGKVDEYVSAHLGRLRGKARDIMEFLSVVTIYSNSGIPRAVVNRIMNLQADTSVGLEEILGEGPARLVVVRDGGLRIMHQVLAEHVLQKVLNSPGDSWRADLKDICIDFIRESVRAVGDHSRVLVDLFKELFIDRQGVIDQEIEDRMDFSPLIEEISAIEKTHAKLVFETLTDAFPGEAHFWNHRGRFIVYKMGWHDISEAESFLRTAIRLAPDDALHHHTYGLVKRSRIRQILRSSSNSSPYELLDRVNDLFEEASSAFARARSIKAENMHGYITHTQMILDIALELKKLCGVSSVAEISDSVQSWVRENLVIAQDLLADVEALYGSLQGENRYVTDCRSNLKRLMGDLDEVVRLWEIHHASGHATAWGRRALALAYFERRERSWRRLELGELQSIKDLVEKNLASSARRDEDYRLWFEAYRHMPDFDIDEAISRLATWADRTAHWRPHYYLYALYFLKWFFGQTDSTSEMDAAMEACKKLYIGRRGASFLWLGHGPERCPLVSTSDLGEFDRRGKNFWKNDKLLRRVAGVIDERPLRPQSGVILIDGLLPAFFVPGRDFIGNQHENQAVSFFLALSAEGLRAWSVTSGAGNGLERTRLGQVVPRGAVLPTLSALTSEELRIRAEKIKLDRLLAFAEDYLSARHQSGADVSLKELSCKIDALFGVDDAVRQVSGMSIDALLKGRGEFIAVAGADGIVFHAASQRIDHRERRVGKIHKFDSARQFGFIIDDEENERYFSYHEVHRGARSSLRSNVVVTFVPAKNESGQDVARDVRIPDPHVEASLLPPSDPEVLALEVHQRAIQFVKAAQVKGQPMGLRKLSAALEARFPGENSLPQRIGYASWTEFLRSAGSFVVEGEHPKIMVSLACELAFGRLPGGARGNGAAAAGQAAKITSREVSFLPSAEMVALGQKVEATVQEFLHDRCQAGHSVTLPKAIAVFLEDQFPENKPIYARLGHSTLKALLETYSFVEFERNELGYAVKYNGMPSFEEVRNWCIQKVRDVQTGSQPILMTQLGTLLRQRFPNHSKGVYKTLGFAKLSAMIDAIDDLQLVPCSGGATEVRLKAASPSPHGLPDIASVEDFVVDLIAGQQALRIPGSALGVALGKRYPDYPRVYSFLGFGSLRAMLASMPRLTLGGEHALYISLAVPQSVPEATLVEPSVCALAPGGADSLRSQVVSFLRKGLPYNGADGVELSPQRLTALLGKAFPGEQPAYRRLGYDGMREMLTDVEGVSFDVDRRCYVIYAEQAEWRTTE